VLGPRYVHITLVAFVFVENLQEEMKKLEILTIKPICFGFFHYPFLFLASQ
jgi:hypothetical protein